MRNWRKGGEEKGDTSGQKRGGGKGKKGGKAISRRF